MDRQKDERVEAILHILGGSKDIIVRRFIISWEDDQYSKAAIIYLEGICDEEAIHSAIMTSLLDRTQGLQFVPDEALDRICSQVLTSRDVIVLKELDQAVDKLLMGSVLLLIEMSPGIVAIPIPKAESRSITESKTQSVVRGPQDSFTEAIGVNITLIRRRVKDPRLRVKPVQAGAVTKTEINLVYLQGFADEKLVADLIGKLQTIQLDSVLEGQYVEGMIKGTRWELFPTVYNTDRPDIIAAGLIEGKVALIIDGTPFVLLVPAVFVEFVHSIEDYYQSTLYSSVIRLLRFFTVLIVLLAPATYITLTTFHQDTLPTQLLLSLAAQREGIPFPAFVEALIMEVSFEILREAGIRMPRTIGQAVSIVGTIVIGQAAVEASIVSAAMVIVVAITAISSFVIPSYNLAFAIRLLRFAFMGAAAVFGFYGITALGIMLVLYLCSLDSFGVPYMRPLAPYRRRKQKDALIRIGYGTNE